MERRQRADDAVPVGASEACRQLRCSLNTVFRLGHLDAIEIVRNDGERGGDFVFWLSPGDDRTTIYRRWCLRVREWNHRTAVRHKDLRSACAIAADEPQPDGLDAFAARTFAAIGASGRIEANAFFVDPGREALDRDRVRLRMVGERSSRGTGPKRVSLEPRLAALAHPELHQLPDTCLDPRAGDICAPGGLIVASALAVPMMAGAATMFLLLAAAPGRSDRQLRAYVRSFRLVAERLHRLGHVEITGEALQHALTDMLAEAKLSERGSSALCQACNLFRTAVRYLSGYVARVDADGSRGLARLLPPKLPDDARVQRTLFSTGKKVIAEGRERRKRLGDPVADRLEPHERAARFALDQITAIHQDSLAAAKDLRRHCELRDAMPEQVRRRTPAFVEFVVPVARLDAHGELVRGEAVELVFWAWRERDAWLSLEPDALRLQRGMSRRRRSDAPSIRDRALVDAALHAKITDVRRNPDRYDGVVFEYRGAARGPGDDRRPDRRYDPRFVTLCRFGADASPSFLSARRQRQRHRLLQSWNISPAYRSPEGLLRFGQGRITLARWMDDRNRLLLPIAERYHATRIAVLGFDIIAETLCRASEAIQPVHDPSGWVTDDATGETVIAFLAATKASGRTVAAAEPRPMVVSEPLFVDAMAVAEELAIAAGREDGWLPKVSPAEGIPRQSEPGSGGKVRPLEAAPFILQWNGRHLHATVLGELIRSLFANRGVVTPHLVRRAGANRLRELGVAEPVIQAILGHRTVRMTIWYMMETIRQAVRRRRDEARDARVGAAEAHGRFLARRSA